MTVGLAVLAVTILGYISNFLNWRYINTGIIRALYYIGAFVHETSHALFCILTGARIRDYTVFSAEPHVIHEKSKVSLAGDVIISFAPIAGGMAFLFFINQVVLGNYFKIPQFSDWHSLLTFPFLLLTQINFLAWQSWVMIFLFFNAGAMIGPSLQDLKSIWLAVILLFFIRSPFLANLALTAASLILVNISIQIVVIAMQAIGRLAFTKNRI